MKVENLINMRYNVMNTMWKKCGAFLFCALSATVVLAQQTYNEMELLTVNDHVTTMLTASEPVKLVDVSTHEVVCDRPLDNVIRLKPASGEHEDGDILAIVTIVTERYRAQYGLIYTSRIEEAVTDKEVQLSEQMSFHNPTVTLSSEDMVMFARKVWNSPAKYRNIKSSHHKMTMRLNNIYSVADYFFLDFSVENKTNIRFDIDELRVKLQDKKQSKATNVQTIELQPALVLDKSQSFRYGYRNVIVVKKMTFPNDKVLTIELSEKQISGRTIAITVDYEDVLAADSFDHLLLKEE